MSDFVTWLRGLAEKGGKGLVGNIDARCLGRVADELAALRAQLSEANATIAGMTGALEKMRDSPLTVAGPPMIVDAVQTFHRLVVAEVNAILASIPTGAKAVLEVVKAARDLRDDVRKRYPGEPFRCPIMQRLDAALATMTEDGTA